jgi:hypothetical protein
MAIDMLLGSRLAVDTGAIGSTESSCTNLLDPTNLVGSDKTALISSSYSFVGQYLVCERRPHACRGLSITREWSRLRRGRKGSGAYAPQASYVSSRLSCLQLILGGEDASDTYREKSQWEMSCR